MSNKLLILPPLAFARIGLSENPVDWFLWGPNDASLFGRGKTTAYLADESADPYDPIVFRDGDEIRPVCPYFELFEVRAGETIVPVTSETYQPTDVTWSISLGNLKAFYRTFEEGDKVLGSLTVRADTRDKITPVYGWSPKAAEPLVLKRDPIHFGDLEVLEPQNGRPYRIRFWPPKGLVYAPTNIHTRTPALGYDDKPESERIRIRATLNPEAS